MSGLCRIIIIMVCSMIFSTTVSAGMPEGKETVLPNGLTVITRAVHTSPIVAVDIWVKTGSVNEVARYNGIAHFTEHMLFKGTPTRGTGVIDQEIKALGGYNNAATSLDYTHYYAVVPSQYWDTALAIQLDMVFHPLFDPAEINRERKVVLEEINRAADTPEHLLWDTLLAALFSRQNYRFPILGTADSLANIDREAFLAFHRQYYVPENITVVVVGDIDPKEVVEEVTKLTAGIKRQSPPNVTAPPEPPFKGVRRTVVEKDVQQAYFLMGFPTVSFGHPDAPVLEVIAAVLGTGKSSRIHQQLKTERSLLTSFAVSNDNLRFAGIFSIQGELAPEKLAEGETAVLEQLERLKRERVGGKELAKAKRLLTSQFIFANEKVAQQAHTLGFYHTMGELSLGDYRRAVERVTPADIQRVARRYFNSGAYAIAVVKPKQQEVK